MGHHSTWPEWIYIGVVVALLVWVGAEAWNVERLVEHVPADAEVIKVTGQQWFWTFEHEDGTKEIGELHVEAGKAYKFEVTSTDVIHSFNIHDYVVLMDAVPGRVNTVWFAPTEPGEHEDGTKEIVELHVEAGKAYKFEVTSTDVIHSFNIHDYVVLMDAVPGRINTVWFSPTEPGEHDIQCREYCGLIHYNMRGKLIVEEAS